MGLYGFISVQHYTRLSNVIKQTLKSLDLRAFREALNKFEFYMRQGANKKYRRSICNICKAIFCVSNAVS